MSHDQNYWSDKNLLNRRRGGGREENGRGVDGTNNSRRIILSFSSSSSSFLFSFLSFFPFFLPSPSSGFLFKPIFGRANIRLPLKELRPRGGMKRNKIPSNKSRWCNIVAIY